MKKTTNYSRHEIQWIRQTFQINPTYNSIQNNLVADSEYLFSLIQAFSSLNKRQGNLSSLLSRCLLDIAVRLAIQI